MKTLEELRIQMQNASTLTDRTAIRIKMIEANRLSQKPDNTVTRPMSTFLSNLHGREDRRLQFRPI